MLAEDWRGFPAPERGEDGVLDVPCTSCPKFRRLPARCTVPIGSRVRSCICASAELHLRDVRDKDVVELGCGESSFVRCCVEAAGGRWIGLDQRGGKGGRASVRSIAAHAQHIPVRDASVDVVFGSQLLEHLEDPLTPQRDCDYGRTMGEIWRVLRPGGWVYLDAPIHLHGASEFIRGDLEAVGRVFRLHGWRAVRMLSWRRLHAPLRPHRAPRREWERWASVLADTSPAEIESLRRRAVWILAVRAEKPAPPSDLAGFAGQK